MTVTTLLVALVLMTSMGIMISTKYTFYMELDRDKKTVRYVERLFPILNTYYETECYANSGVIPSTITLADIKDGGYVVQSFSDTPQGNLNIQIDSSTMYATLNISLVFNTVADATRVSKLHSKHSFNLSGNTITWFAKSSEFKNYNVTENKVWFSNSSICL